MQGRQTNGAQVPRRLWIVVAAVVLSTVHNSLERADAGEVAQPELDALDQVEREEDVRVAAGIGNEG